MGSPVVSPEDVLESLMNDGTIDSIRLKIINQLKANVSLAFHDFCPLMNQACSTARSYFLHADCQHNMILQLLRNVIIFFSIFCSSLLFTFSSFIKL